jgi:Na+/H+-translocating membrane pyrophosphatase
MFLAGSLMLLAGLVPVVVALISGWSAMSGVSLLTVFAPIGAILMALARSKVSREWRQGK